jgi:hypothetical protein
MRAVLVGLLLLFTSPLQGQLRTLLIQVSDVAGRPISGAVLSGTGPSTVSPPTDSAGRTQIQFGNQDDGACKVLRIVRPELVFISPWDACVPLRPQGQQGNPILVVVSRPGDKAMLESGTAIKALLQQTLSVANARSSRSGISRSDLETSLSANLRQFGFTRSEVEASIARMQGKADDPELLRELAAFGELLKNLSSTQPQQEATNGSFIIGSGTSIKDATISLGGSQQGGEGHSHESANDAQPFPDSPKIPRKTAESSSLDDEKIEMLRIRCAEDLDKMMTRSDTSGKVFEVTLSNPNVGFYRNVCKESVPTASVRDFQNPTWYTSWSSHPVLFSCTAQLREQRPSEHLMDEGFPALWIYRVAAECSNRLGKFLDSRHRT